MICDNCNEKITNEMVVVDLGCMGKLCYCDDDCKENHLDEHTTNQVLDEELEALEDKYYDYK